MAPSNKQPNFFIIWTLFITSSTIILLYSIGLRARSQKSNWLLVYLLFLVLILLKLLLMLLQENEFLLILFKISKQSSNMECQNIVSFPNYDDLLFLFKHLKTLLVAISLQMGLPSAFKRFTRWVNLFCISTTVSPCFIWKCSNSWFKVLILAHFFSFVPSWATCNESHIALAVVQWETQ